MLEKGIVNLGEVRSELMQRETWSILAENIADTFKKGKLIGEMFLDNVVDLINLGKYNDVVKLVTRYYKHYGEGKSGKAMFENLVDLGYLDISRGKDYKNFIEPTLIEAAMCYSDANPDKSDIIKKTFHIK